MSRRLHQLRQRLAAPLRPFAGLGRRLVYLPRLALGKASGHLRYGFRPSTPPGPWVEIRLAKSSPVSAAEAAAWCKEQTHREIFVTNYDADGSIRWRIDADGPLERSPAEASPSETLLLAPGRALPEVYPAWLESALWVLAAEEIDAVLLRERLATPPRLSDPDTLLLGPAADPDLRRHALLRADAYAWDPATDTLAQRGGRRLLKAIDSGGVGEAPRDRAHFGRYRRGPYLSSAPLPSTLEIGVRDVGPLARLPLPATPGKEHLVVLISFLAHGGIEHTLFETLRALRDRFDFTLVTLAPHAAARGDRRADFHTVTERIYSLGDIVHPAAMYGIVRALIDQSGARAVYNASGTTLFYEIARRLQDERPALRVIDHLYDHRVGYITWYDESVLRSVDVCVAENHLIAETLAERGWSAERTPVIWPCGRRPEEFPSLGEAPAVRAAIRRELEIGEEEIVFLTAARMHAQKRPLDLVALAQRTRDLPARFLIVGGGDLEVDVDRAVARARALAAKDGGPPLKITRCSFRDDIPKLIVASDVGCLVSDFEGLPVFMMECMQAGRPFLGTRVGDLGRVLDASGAGLVVDRPGDLDALADAVRRLCDQSLRAGLAARTVDAARWFEIPVCAARYGRVFRGEPVDGDPGTVREGTAP